MNNGQRRVLTELIRQALTHRKGTISIPLACALLQIDETHLRRLEREGLFPHRIQRADGSRGYHLKEVYEWLKDVTPTPQ